MKNGLPMHRPLFATGSTWAMITTTTTTTKNNSNRKLTPGASLSKCLVFVIHLVSDQDLRLGDDLFRPAVQTGGQGVEGFGQGVDGVGIGPAG